MLLQPTVLAFQLFQTALPVAPKGKYVLVSKAVLTAILVTAGVTTIGGAWGAAKAAIESSAAKNATAEIEALRNEVAALRDEAKADRQRIASILADASTGKLGDVEITGDLSVSGKVASASMSAESINVGTQLQFGGGTGMLLQTKNDKPSIAIGYGGGGNADPRQHYAHCKFFIGLNPAPGASGTIHKVGF